MEPGNAYQPKHAPFRQSRFTLTAPSRNGSIYDLVGDLRTPTDKVKPRLLNHVVREEELKSIVSRLTKPTISSRNRAVNFRPQCSYSFVDMGHYQWNRMQLYTDYQRHMYTSIGAVQPGFKRTVKANYWPFYY